MLNYLAMFALAIAFAQAPTNTPRQPYQWRELYAPASVPNWVLAALAGWAGFMALGTLRAINKQAGLMENQGDLTEKTIVLQFRPRIVVRTGEVRTSMVAEFGERASGKVGFTIVNTGGSNAKIIGCEAEASVFEDAYVAILKNPETLTPFELKAGESRPFTASLNEDVNEAIREADLRHAGTLMGGSKKYIYFVGVVWYVDDIGIQRRTGFSRRYDAGRKQFVVVEDPDREYND
jgi:hypothetical protein